MFLALVCLKNTYQFGYVEGRTTTHREDRYSFQF